ncbi:MAG: DUF2911 domain-containing protein [Myxococcota bacterium]
MKMMSSTILCIALGGTAFAAAPSESIPPRGDDAERKSKNGRLEADFDGVPVTVTYGRPKVRGRKVWGGLVQYGRVWRTGADEATVISFDAPAELLGKAVAPGTYALFTVPSGDEWTVILNRQAAQWGAYKYDDDLDVLRAKTKATTAEHVEELRFEKSGKDLVLRWGKLAVPMTITKAATKAS